MRTLSFKLVRSGGKLFILRASLRRPTGSFKLHLILDDDQDGGHTHPWDFKSLVLFGGYYELGQLYGFLRINTKKAEEFHETKLRRFLGFKVPTLTIGWYGPKRILCSLCQSVGYCKIANV